MAQGQPAFSNKLGPDCYERLQSGQNMTDPIGRKKSGSLSSLEILSIAAILLILVMAAIPVPYTSWNRGFPGSRTALGQGYVAADTRSSSASNSIGGGKISSVGYASQGSPFEVRTVGQREFCADMPGVVRFSTAGAPCRNGRLAARTPPHHEQSKP
jgi:hypothetical protein